MEDTCKINIDLTKDARRIDKRKGLWGTDMETIDRRLHSSFAKKKVFGLATASVEYPGELYCEIKENFGMVVTAIGGVKNDDCSLGWYKDGVSDRKYIKCTEFEHTQLPVGRGIIEIFYDIYVDETIGVVTDTRIWSNNVCHVGGRCIATVAGVRKFKAWHEEAPKLLIEIETKPGEVAMFSTSARDFEIKYRDISITGESWLKSGATYLFKDGEYAELEKGYVTSFTGIFTDTGDIMIPIGDVVEEVAKDKEMTVAEVLNNWSTYEIAAMADTSSKVSRILGVEPTILANAKLEWSIRISEDWSIHAS